MTTHTKTVSNGVDIEALGQTIKAVQVDPLMAKSVFRVQNKWISGGHNQSHVSCFHSLGGEQSHEHSFELHSDEPAALGGTDLGANPVEHLLNALAGCVTTSIVAHAAVHGIPVEEVQSQVEGDIDIQGIFGLDPSVPKGFQNIRVTFKIKAAPEDIPRLREFAEFSPVYNTLTQGTNVDIRIQSE